MLDVLREELTASAASLELQSRVAEANAIAQSILDKIVRAAEAAMNAKEDGTRTLIQSGRVTRPELEGELTEVLDKLYPVLRGAYNLRSIFDIENAAIKSALALSDTQEIENQTKKIAGLGRTLDREIKKLLPRVPAEIATTLRELSELLAGRAEMLTGDQGLLSAHIRAQAALDRANARRTNIDELIFEADAALENTILAAEGRKAASEEGAQSAANLAIIVVGTVIAVALLLSVLVGTVFVRIFALPIKALTGSQMALAKGDMEHEVPDIQRAPGRNRRHVPFA